MPRQGDESGIPCECGGMLLDILDTKPQNEHARVLRIRECDTCGGRQNTRETKFGPLRPGVKRIDTADLDEYGMKRSDSFGQRTFSELLSASGD
jgi:hypothetical protein